jgi:hypothetical protein
LKFQIIQSKQERFIIGMAAGFCLLACVAGQAQMAAVVEKPAMVASDVLPDAPGAVAYSSSLAFEDGSGGRSARATGRSDETSTQGAVMAKASQTQSTIEPGQTAPAQSAGDMMVMGLKDTFSLTAVAGWFTSAGYSHWRNSAPNYGTDRGAFGERLGAAALENSTEDLLTETVMAPLLHEDARYYRMGPGHNLLLRGIYAATRPVITKTTSGRTTPNLALILGNAEGAALANAYYPQVNRGGTQTMENLGLSIGGSAIGDVLAEYFEGVMYKMHLRH